MRAIQVLAAALVVAASAAGAEDPTYEGSLRPAVGSPCGYLELVDDNIPRDASVRFIESSSADGKRASIRQTIARRGPMRGELIVALRGLAVNTTYDVVIDRPGRRPLVATAAYRAEQPTIQGGLDYMSDGRAGPGQELMLWHGPCGRRLRVEVGGIRARIVSGPWHLSDRHALEPDVETSFLVPRLPPGPAEVVVTDECGWSASAGSIEVLARPREISFRAKGRRFRSDFQEARGGSDWFYIDTVDGKFGPDVYFVFDLKSDVRTATLPATYTQQSPGVAFTLGLGTHEWAAGEWTLTVEEIADGEVRGTFSARLVDPLQNLRIVNFTGGLFRVPFSVSE